MSRKVSKSFHLPDEHIDVNEFFAEYKFAVPEHEPIQLSNGDWLHTYRLTPYGYDYMAYGDPDEEEALIADMVNGPVQR